MPDVSQVEFSTPSALPIKSLGVVLGWDGLRENGQEAFVTDLNAGDRFLPFFRGVVGAVEHPGKGGFYPGHAISVEANLESPCSDGCLNCLCFEGLIDVNTVIIKFSNNSLHKVVSFNLS